MKKDQLHLLLRRLTKSEKRYFRLFSKRSGDKSPKNYLTLFDLLTEAPTYDEEKLIAELKKRNINTKYLAADKNYLYISVLDALRTYNANYSAKQQVRRQLDFADILAEKGLPEQTAKVLRKAKNIAVGNDAAQYLPEILQTERKLKGNVLNEKDLEKSRAEMQRGNAIVRRLYENEFYYRENNLSRLRYGKTKDTEVLTALENRRAETLAEQVENPTFAAQKWLLQAEAAHNYIKNDVAAEFKSNTDLLQLMENTPGFVKVNPLQYISVFSRILILSKQTAPDDYPELLQQFIAFADSVNRENRKVKARVYSIAYSTEMVRIIQAKDFTVGQKLIPTVTKLMHDYRDLIDAAFSLNNYYKFAYIHIGLENYEAALENLNELLDTFPAALRPDIYGYAKILLCVCHYKLGNLTLLPHLVSTAKYYLRKEKRLFETERLFLQFMHNIGKTYQSRADFTVLQNQLKNLDKTKEPAQAYFDFAEWINAQINNEPTK